MKVFNVGTIRHWAEEYPDAATAIERWYGIAQAGAWRNTSHMKASTGFSVDIINHEVAVFDILNNRYRLVGRIDYDRGWIFLTGFLTHAAYLKTNVANLTFPKR